ncbi:hydantoinase/oxoprolinase N-terminal domain-containing protein [Streptomyces sp. NPDC006129]|uniref:hydantoinase/oxoprolinase N-terminal domain-containing protein n=1 Tax=Streptomyces sp. NPDC006129 TaxID=3155348 RepID=UPI00339E2768
MEGKLRGVRSALSDAGVAPGAVTRVVHATTLATNAIPERKGVRVAHVATRRFRSMLPLGRYASADCFDVPERIDHQGGSLAPLDESAVRQVAERIGAAGVDAVAVCLGPVGGPAYVLEDFPPTSMRPGDVFMTDDAYSGGIHTNDLLVFRPVFVDERVEHFTVTLIHVSAPHGRRARPGGGGALGGFGRRLPGRRELAGTEPSRGRSQVRLLGGILGGGGRNDLAARRYRHHWEHDAHRYFKRAHGSAHLFGSPGWHRARRSTELVLVPS